MLRKLKYKKGETIAEVLASILVVSLSSAMLAVMIGAAVRINRAANAESARIYQEITAAEQAAGGGEPGDAVVNGVTVEITYSSMDDGGLTAYQKGGAGG